MPNYEIFQKGELRSSTNIKADDWRMIEGILYFFNNIDESQKEIALFNFKNIAGFKIN